MNIDAIRASISQLDKEKEELNKQLMEAIKQEEEAKNKVSLIIIHHFNKDTGVIELGIDNFRDDVVNELRTIPGRFYSYERQLNYFRCEHLEKFLTAISSFEKLEIRYNNKTVDEIAEWITAPALVVSLDAKKSLIKFTLHKKIGNIRFYNPNWQTLVKKGDNYYISVTEAHLIPEGLKDFNFTKKIEPEVQNLIDSQAETEELFRQIQVAEDCPEIETPELFKERGFSLTPRQRVAIKFAELTNNRSILAYWMGTGKTAISIAIAERSDLRVLFLCKGNLKTNIRNDIKKFTGKDATIYSGIEPDNLAINKMIIDKTQYNIINYEIVGRNITDSVTKIELMKWVELINLSQFDIIFCDEAHMMKNLDSQRSKAGRGLKAKGIIHLTGTPIVNRPIELWPLLNIVAPNDFHSITSFSSSYCNWNGTAKNVDLLRDTLKRYMIVREGNKVDINQINHTFELDSISRGIYNKALDGLYISLQTGQQYNITNVLAELIRLKQIISMAAVDNTAELIEDALEETGKKVLVYSYFKDVHGELVKKLGSKCRVLNGDVRSDDLREEIKAEFQDPNSGVKVLVSNIEEGLTLTEAWTVIFNDHTWTPKTVTQFSGRAFGRENDPHGGNIYHVIAENTIAETIQKILDRKIGVINEVVHGHRKIDGDVSIVNELITTLRGY